MITKLGPLLFAMVFVFLSGSAREYIAKMVQDAIHKATIYAPFSYFLLFAPMIGVVILLTWPSKPEEPHYYDE
jgi:hypothetical protein